MVFLQKPEEAPLRHSPPLAVKYLAPLSSLSLQCLQVARSTVTSFYRVVHSHESIMANHVVVHHLFKARRRTRNKLPSRYQEMFDIDSILNLVGNWECCEWVDIRTAEKKTLVLLTIVTIWKLRSGLGNL